LFPSLWVWPDEWVIRPAAPLDSAVNWITANYGADLSSLKAIAFYYFLLPLKIGLVQAVTPMTWGVSFDLPAQIAYWVVVGIAAVLAAIYSGGTTAAIIAVMAILLFYGTTGIPWPVFIAIVTLTAYRAGGIWPAAFALLAQLFILISGFWPAAMLSVYLCVAAVAICIAIGVSLGAAAANNDHLSAMLRPINDGLQTIPQFVLLIPALMFFQAGDFTALLAIILYAIVPAIKYTEAGLRNVSASSLEAGVALGCTKRQMFWQVRLPQAVPEILLGVNQTIMYALAMLVIAALVGTTDLGQEVYIALGKADAGSGLVAGISMALIAMIADRVLQNAASSRKAALGLPT
jgi:glycine betaine/proline transport system permease protein